MSSSFYSQIGIPSTNSTAIQSSVNQAATSETNSAASATNSASSASASAASATAANAADVSATQSKNAAATSETNSAASAAQSATSSAAAVTAQTASETAKTASELAATNASTSETNAAASATSAASSLAAIGTSVTASAASATSAASSLSTFQNQYLGAAATAPTLDPDGSALDLGDLWFDTASDTLKVYASGGWVNAGSSVNGTSERQTYTATAGQTTFAVTYDAGFVDVWLNGVKLLVGTDFTATSGTNIVLSSGATVNDIVDIIAFGTFALSTHYTKTQSDARYIQSGGSGSYADSDVDTHLNQSSATSGQYLKWNGTDYAWDVVAAGYANSDVDTHLNQSTATSGKYLKWNGSDYAWDVVPAGYTDSDVNTHLNQSSATSGQYLQWNGSDYAWAAVAAGYSDSDVDAHLLTAGVTLDATNDRVGIGTQTPTKPLSVNLAGGGDFIAEFQNTTDATPYGIHVKDAASGANGYPLFQVTNGGGTETYLRVDSGTGNTGLGTSAPLRQLHIHNTSANSEIAFTAATNGVSSILFGDGQTGADVYRGYVQYNHANDNMLFGIDAVGLLTINRAANSFGLDFVTHSSPYGMRVRANGSYSHQEGIILSDHPNNLKWKANMDGSSSQIGAANATAFNATSDYRLKENIEDLTDGITKVKQLQPRKFNWISDETDTLEDGFIAHEVATVVPSVVRGSKDEVVVWQEGEELPDGVSLGDDKLDDDGNTTPEYQGIEYGKLVPVLTKALQEAIAKIETLETQSTTQATQIADLTTRLEALEAN